LIKNKLDIEETVRLIHWSSAEKVVFNKAMTRSSISMQSFNNNFEWFDLLEVFKNERIAVNGALNYGLKTIAKAMHKHKLISTNWNTNSKCSNGLNAMILAYDEYEKNKNVKEPIKKNSIMIDIMEYNEIDCKVLWEIISYLRNA
jgi:predicted RecB family nuclease